MEIIYKLKPKYLVTDFNFDSIAATVTESEKNFNFLGVFRTNRDLCGMSWKTIDELDYIDFRYPENGDFTGVYLTYNYYISGYTHLLSDEQAPVMTIKTYSGDNYYVRLWNYVPNRPEDTWEYSSGHHFPEGRSFGNDSGIIGTIVLDFNNLYSGWTPYHWVEGDYWEPDPNWVKVPVDEIKEILWSYIPNNYTEDGGTKYLAEPLTFEIQYRNWTVSGNRYLCDEPSTASITSDN